MTRPRHLIMSAALAVAFLSAGAFAQVPDAAGSAQAGKVNVTVISKSSTSGFAS